MGFLGQLSLYIGSLSPPRMFFSFTNHSVGTPLPLQVAELWYPMSNVPSSQRPTCLFPPTIISDTCGLVMQLCIWLGFDQLLPGICWMDEVMGCLLECWAHRNKTWNQFDVLDGYLLFASSGLQTWIPKEEKESWEKRKGLINSILKQKWFC